MWIEKKILDEKGYGGAVLMDLSKAFVTLNHELLIAKLSAYGFNNEPLNLTRSYLTLLIDSKELKKQRF